jgi:Protein of unknown function (DUF1592)/Protein of unknown function (DUF1588)/Protein of unknown function (DUF1595)/Protein of unknown function (DUF1585)/Protein of unknown function (DUF1587)
MHHTVWSARTRAAIAAVLTIAGCYAGNSDDARVTGADGASSDGTLGDPSGAASAGDDDSTGAPLDPEAFEPGALVLPRLTAVQYRNTLVALLGDDLPPTPVEPDTNPYLFYTIGATSTTLSELGTQQYEEAADAVTHAVFDDATRRAALLGCEPTGAGDGCVSQFLASFGRRAFRRPLSDAEHARWLQASVDLAQPDAIEGLRLAVAGMLQSPHFLYRVELGEPDPELPDRVRYTGWEMASRLSYLLWNTMPDDALFAAADRGDLLEREGITTEVERMLADPRASETIQFFFAQFLDLGRLDGITKDAETFPAFTLTMPDAMRTEVELLVEDVVLRSQGDTRSIFSTRRTFVNDELAALYGVEAPGAGPITYVPVELPDDGPRAGILSLGAFLTMNAKETRTSPTARGKYVRERVLCQSVPPPPQDVDTDLDPPSGTGVTQREILEEHRLNPACAGCHAFIDPPGLLFESFDGMGAFRELENGVPVDASGDLDGVPLDGARELAALLENDPRVGRCMVTQLFRHAQGRLETEQEAPVIDDIDARFAAAEYRFLDLLVELATHEGFRTAVHQEGG